MTDGQLLVKSFKLIQSLPALLPPTIIENMIDNSKLQILGCTWAEGLAALIQETYGLTIQKTVNGFELSTEGVLNAKIKDVLVRHHEVDITGKNLHIIAQKMVSQIGNDFPSTTVPIRDSIDVLGDYGNLTRLDEYKARLAADVDGVMASLLAEHLLPFLRENFMCTRALGITAQVTHFQRMLTISKTIAFCADKTLKEAEVSIFEKRSGSAIRQLTQSIASAQRSAEMDTEIRKRDYENMDE